MFCVRHVDRSTQDGTSDAALFSVAPLCLCFQWKPAPAVRVLFSARACPQTINSRMELIARPKSRMSVVAVASC
jgi:hypothetical protein